MQPIHSAHMPNRGAGTGVPQHKEGERGKRRRDGEGFKGGRDPSLRHEGAATNILHLL